MRYIGIDYGVKRIGIAVSDEDGQFAFPREIIPAEKAIETIVHICDEEKMKKIIIGASIASNESANELHMSAQRFAALIAEKTKLPVTFEREDYSSVEAHRYQTSAGNRDDSAAAIILQRFLDKQKK